MPIRLNLLAEAHALEEMRRRDPVKRAIWIAAALGCVVLVWGGSLQFKALVARREVGRMEARLATHTNAYRLVLDNQRKLGDAHTRLNALRQLSTNRFLQGSLLNALQQATLDDVQLTRFRSDQTYVLTDEVKPGTDPENRSTLPRAATATERIALILEAKDTSSPNPGDQVNKFKKAIAECAYFQSALGKTNEPRLANLSPPRNGPDGAAYVAFTLECRFPDKAR